MAERGAVSDWVAFVGILILCLLLVSEVPMFGIKNFGSWKPACKILLAVSLLLAVLLLVLWGYKAFMVIVGTYILFNLLMMAFRRTRERRAV